MVQDKFLLILILSFFVGSAISQTANDYVYCNTLKEFANGQTLLIYFAEPGNTRTTCEYVVRTQPDKYIAVEVFHNLAGSGTSCSTQYVQISPDGDPRYRSSVKYCGLRDANNPLRFNTIGTEVRFKVVSNDLTRTVQIRMRSYPITSSNCSCSWNPTTRIANGQDTAASSFIGNVAFKTTLNRFYQSFCGGTLISYNFALTAAHCVTEINKYGLANVQMHVGRQNVTADTYFDTVYSEQYEIAAVGTHPNYDSANNLNDIGFVRTRIPVRYSRGVGPACITFSYENFAVPSGTTLTAIGFGATDFAMGPSIDTRSWILQNTRLNVNQSLASGCNQKQRICAQGNLNSAGTGRGDTCQRDSGTGVYAYINNLFQFMAITSEGVDCGSFNSYSINVHISHYVPWIRSIVGTQLLCNKS